MESLPLHYTMHQYKCKEDYVTHVFYLSHCANECVEALSDCILERWLPS